MDVDRMIADDELFPAGGADDVPCHLGAQPCREVLGHGELPEYLLVPSGTVRDLPALLILPEPDSRIHGGGLSRSASAENRPRFICAT
jgi:hypothetical protein